MVCAPPVVLYFIQFILPCIHCFLQSPIHSSVLSLFLQVRASVVYVPEYGPPGRHLFAYSVRFALLPAEQQLAAAARAGESALGLPLKSCQLTTRRWLIRDAAGGVTDTVRHQPVHFCSVPTQVGNVYTLATQRRAGGVAGTSRARARVRRGHCATAGLVGTRAQPRPRQASLAQP